MMATTKTYDVSNLAFNNDGTLIAKKITDLSERSSWLDSIALVETVYPGVSALVWCVQSRSDRIYSVWFGPTAAVSLDYLDIAEGKSPGRQLHLAAHRYPDDLRDLTYIREIKLAANGGLLTSQPPVAYSYSDESHKWTKQDGISTTFITNQSVAAKTDDRVLASVLALVAALPDSYKDEVRKVLA